jgi:hypothetical protein
MDRSAVTGLVEDYWRTIITATQASGASAMLEISQRFEQRVDETANLMEPIDRAVFLQTVEAERERMMAEYNANPVAFKKRLGVALGVDAVQNRQRQGSGLGGLAVRTAVRATIWESIWAIFRAFR